MSKYTKEFKKRLEDAAAKMRGVQITKKEYDELVALMDQIKWQVLAPAYIHDKDWRKGE